MLKNAKRSHLPADEVDHLGDVSLSFGLYVDNSGSFGAIKQYIGDAAAYIIHLFQGISSTRTGKDKFFSAIKTFDTRLNSFKGFDDELSKDEARILSKAGIRVELAPEEAAPVPGLPVMAELFLSHSL